MDIISNKFIESLSNLGVSKLSLKNYRSDLNHFSQWILLKVRSWGTICESLAESIPFLSRRIASEYKLYLIQNQIPSRTINRRLSTLRQFAKFLNDTGHIPVNFAEGLSNIGAGKKPASSATEELIEAFRLQLEREKVSHNTIKAYLSDIKQFFSWIEEQNAKNLHFTGTN